MNNPYLPGHAWIDFCYPTSPLADKCGFANGCYVVRQQTNYVADKVLSVHASVISAVRELRAAGLTIHPIMQEGWRGEAMGVTHE